MKSVSIATIACLAAIVCAKAETFSVVSPDGRNEIRLEADGALCYSVWRDGVQRLATAEVSLSVRGRMFSPHVVSSETFNLSGEERTLFYKKASVSLVANGRRIALSDGFGIELIARNDGVAYRFTTDFPEDEILVESETAPVRFPSGDISVWAGFPRVKNEGGHLGYISDWESIYTNFTSAAVGLETGRLVALPLVAEYADGVCVCVTESDQRDYPGWILRGSGTPCRLDGVFAPEPVEEACTGKYHHDNMTRHDYIAKTQGARTYPWRLFILAASCAKLCESDAPYALAAPCRLDDVSWIRPGFAQWDWWHNRNLTRVDFKAGMNTATYLHYVDFAADNGVPYVIIDGGWSDDYNVLNHKPELELEKVAARAKARGVKLLIWTPWAALIGRQDETFRAYAKLGIAGAKIDGISRNDRFLTSFLEETARIAAQYRLVIDYHGVSKPSGLNRIYPNVLTYEGVYGLENTKWAGGPAMPLCNMPRNDVASFFCRMTAGPMDYTPGAMRNFAKGRYHFSYNEPGSEGTRTRQLALYVMFESPLQMLPDSPERYRANPECFAFMRTVPTVWDDTCGLTGKIGEYASVARRSGTVWYVGAMTDWSERDLEIDTSFLGNSDWDVEVFEDGVNADRDGTDWKRRVFRVCGGEKIPIHLAPGGGWVARFFPASQIACGLTSSSSRHPRTVIATGWDVCRATLDEILESADLFADTPIDGIAFNLRVADKKGKIRTSGHPAESPFVWTKEMVSDDVPKLRKMVSHKGLSESIVALLYHPSKRIAWDDDARWADIAATMRTVAWAAKQGGVRGFLVDPEDYGKQGQFSRLPGEPPYETLAATVRARARQLFGGVFAEHPDATVLSYWLLSFSMDYSKTANIRAAAAERNDLWPAFVEGMVEAAPPSVRLVDGCENAYRYEAAFGHFNAAAALQRNMVEYLLPENRARYRSQVDVGFGMWLGMYLPKGSRRAEMEERFRFDAPCPSATMRLADNLEQALDASDGYVWLYNASERTGWIPWRTPKFAQWGLWEKRLPGITDVVKAVKDPQGWLDAELAKTTVERENLVPEDKRQSTNLSNGEKYKIHIVHLTVKPGEFYGVRARLLGDDMQPIVRWRRSGEKSRPFAVPSVPISFREPYVGKARVVQGLVRVPAGVTTLDFVVRAEPSKVPAIIENVEIWKMLSP